MKTYENREPYDLLSCRMVFACFHAWRADGTWECIEALLKDRIRCRVGKKKTPIAAVVGSQSMKVVNRTDERGHDNGKRVTGCKRYALVDTLGLVLALKFMAADVSNRAGIRVSLQKFLTTSSWEWVQKVRADSIYRADALCDWIQEAFRDRLWLEIVSCSPEQKGLAVQKWYWVAERTFGWLNKNRGLAKILESSMAKS